MKRLLLLTLLTVFFACTAHGQAFRFEAQVSQEANLLGIPVPVLTVPSGPIVTVCNFPANAVPCTNKATTYTAISQAFPCPTSTQLVLAGTSTCVSNTDQQGNWGVWVAPGVTYSYTISVNGQNLGPYSFTAGGGGGGGGGSNGAINRFQPVLGTALSATDFILTGWGSGASISSVTGTDTDFTLTITAGSAPTITPTITLTYHDGPWLSINSDTAQMTGGTGAVSDVVTSSTLSQMTMTYLSLPITGKTYTVSGLVAGNSTVTSFPVSVNPVIINPTTSQIVTQPGGTSFNIFGISNLTISSNTFLNGVAQISPTNSQGWAGADPGAWTNAAAASCGTSDCAIQYAPGTYNFSTPVLFTQNTAISCLTPADFTGTSVLNWTPATGTMFSVSNSATFRMEGCFLNATANTSSVAIQLGRVVYKSDIERFHISGFTGGIRITGDGVSAFSNGIHIGEGLIDRFCGVGSYAINADHVGDFTYDHVQAYSTLNCATSQPMVLDTGATGIWMSHATFEQGLNSGIVRNTGQGGAYGGTPAAIFIDSISWDLPPGGDALLFDSTLGTADIKFFCSDCWVAGAGKNNSGFVVTAAANGVNIQGGSNIHFIGGTSRANSAWGFNLAGSGTNLSVEGLNIHANNQSNTAGVGGILVGASVINYRLQGNRAGNIIEAGGHQAYGADISAAGAGIVCDNDFANNTINEFNQSTLLNLPVNSNVCGSTIGFTPFGGLIMPGSTNGSSSLNPPATGGAANTLPPVAGPLAVTVASGTSGTITGTSLTATCDSGTVTGLTGATAGMPVIVSTTDGTDIGGAFNIRASVTSAATVTVFVCGTGTPPSKQYNVRVIQ
jgi:hypothetical protein